MKKSRFWQIIVSLGTFMCLFLPTTAFAETNGTEKNSTVQFTVVPEEDSEQLPLPTKVANV